MSNLKKVLSMVLAVMMVMGLMTTAFAAEAKALDYSDSQFQDEAMLLNELGIIVGGDSGAWDGERLVTRGEFCKMICVAMNGGVDNPALYTGDNTTGLTDIDGHWAKGYIIYCFKLGIIAGVGDNTFSPNTSVTGVQAAKILLTALGYDAVKEGYVNVSDWELNINVKAGEVGLYEGLGALYDPRQPVSRDFAAKMISNAFDAFMVYYDQNVNIQIQRTNVNEPLTFGMVRLRLKTVEGVLVANEFASAQRTPGTPGASGTGGYTVTPAPIGKSRVSIKNANGTWTEGLVIPAPANTEDLGKTVKVYARYKTSAGNNFGTYSEEYVERIFGKVSPTSKNNVYKTGRGFGNIGLLNDWLTDNKIRFSDIANEGLMVGLNYATTAYTSAGGTGNTAASAYFAAQPTTPTSGIRKGDTLILIDNNNDRVIDYSFVVRDAFADVTRIDETRAQVRLDNDYWGDTIYNDDIANYDDITLAVDDRVLVWQYAETKKWEINVIEPITGTLTSTTMAGPNHVAVISGKNYQFANAAAGNDAVANGKIATMAKLDVPQNFGTELTYWVDGNNYILDFKGIELNDYCVVTAAHVKDYNNLNDSAKATVEVLMADGTKDSYALKSLETLAAGSKIYKFENNKNFASSVDNNYIQNGQETGGATLNGSWLVGKVFKFIANDENMTIDLRGNKQTVDTRTMNATTANNFGTYSRGTTIAPINAGQNYIVNDKTAIFIKDSSGKWHQYIGRSSAPAAATVNTAAGASVITTWKKTGDPHVAGAFAFTATEATLSDNNRYVIVASEPDYNGRDSNLVVTFKGIYNGDIVPMNSKKGVELVDIDGGQLDASKIRLGDVYWYTGDSSSFTKLERQPIDQTSNQNAIGFVSGNANNVYSLVINEGAVAAMAVVPGVTKYTEILTNGTIALNGTVMVTPEDLRLKNPGKYTTVAVTNSDNVVLDMVYFHSFRNANEAQLSVPIPTAPTGTGGGTTTGTGALSAFAGLTNLTKVANATLIVAAGDFIYNGATKELTFMTPYGTTNTITLSGAWANLFDDFALLPAVKGTTPGTHTFIALSDNLVIGLSSAAGMSVRLDAGILHGTTPLTVTPAATGVVSLTGTAGDVTLAGPAATYDVSGLAANKITANGAITTLTATGRDITAGAALATTTLTARDVTIPSGVTAVLGAATISGNLVAEAGATSTTVGSGTVSGTTTINAGAFIAGTATYSGLVTLNTNGALTLNTASTYNGGLTIGGSGNAVVDLTSAVAGTNSVLTIGRSVTTGTVVGGFSDVRVTGTNVNLTALTITKATTLTHNGYGTLATGAVNGAFALTIAGDNSDSSRVITLGTVAGALNINSGFVTLSGAVTGVTTIAAGYAGTLDATAVGSLTMTAGTEVVVSGALNGGTLKFPVAARKFTLTGAADATLGTDGASDIGLVVASGVATISGTDTTGLTKSYATTGTIYNISVVRTGNDTYTSIEVS